MEDQEVLGSHDFKNTMAAGSHAPSLSTLYVARGCDAHLAQVVVNICHQLLLLRGISTAERLITVQLAEHGGSQLVPALLAEFQTYLQVANTPYGSSDVRPTQRDDSQAGHMQSATHQGLHLNGSTHAAAAVTPGMGAATMVTGTANGGMQVALSSSSHPAAKQEDAEGQQHNSKGEDADSSCSQVEDMDGGVAEGLSISGREVGACSGTALRDAVTAVGLPLPSLPSHSSRPVLLHARAWITAAQLASVIHAVLHQWFPRQARLLPVILQQPYIVSRDAQLRRSLPNIIPAPPDGISADHQGMFELLQYAVGQTPGQPGACGLPYLYHVVWQPFDDRKPWANGQMAVWCTDGCGVWMAMVLRELWFVRASARRPAKQARQEAKRKEQRRATLQAALKQRLACIQQLGRDAAVVVFSAMCVSLVEGLEVVVPSKSISSKHNEQQVAQVLIPALVCKQHAGIAAAAGVDGPHAAMQQQQLSVTSGWPGAHFCRQGTVRGGVLLLGAAAGVLVGIYMLRAAATSRQSGGARGWNWFG